MNLPAELGEALRRGAAVLVAGPGCGALWGQPDWRGRLLALADALPLRGGAEVRALVERGAWLAALATARDRLGPQAARVVAAVTSPPPDRLPGVLTALTSVPWRGVITTGFDESWARALTATGEAPVVVSAGEPLVATGGRLLIHAFGRAARPETMCLAPVDLPERVTAHGLESFLRDLASGCSFVYAGFQPEDPDLEWLVGRVLGPSAHERPHFVLVTGGAAVTASQFRGTFGLKPLPFAGPLEGGLGALAGAAMEASETEASELKTVELEIDNERPPPVPDTVLGRSLREGVDRAMQEERWAAASDGLRRLIDLEAEPVARARLLHARALLLRDVLQDRNGAIAQLELALEADPALVPAWDALEPLQRAGGDAVALRRRYGRALRALGKSPDRALAVRLWTGLAEVCWRSLGDQTTAVAAFEAARALNPDDEGPERALAALYLKAGPDASDRAVAAHQGLVARTPDDAEPYRVLEQLWSAERAPAKATWASAVLAHLGQATDQSNALEVSRGQPTLARTLSEPLWECLYHPDEDRVLSTLFAVLAPSLIPLLESGGGFPSKRAETVYPVDPSPTRPSRAAVGPVAGGFVPAALAHVAQALEVPLPALFMVPRARRALTVDLRADGPTGRPTLIIDRRFAERAREAELLFELARTVALLRTPWVLSLGTNAAAVLDLGLRAARALDGTDPPARDVRRLVQQLRDERPDLARAQVTALANELVHRREPPDVGRWLAAVHLSAARVALVLSADLEGAVRRLRAETTWPGGLAPAERVKDLLAFAVSEDHFSVREALGLELSESAPS